MRKSLAVVGAVLSLAACGPAPSDASASSSVDPNGVKEALTPSPATGQVEDQPMAGAQKAEYALACALAMIAATKAVPALEPAHMHLPWRLSVTKKGKRTRAKCEVFGEGLGDGYVEADVLCKKTEEARCSRPIRVILGGTLYFPEK